MPPRRKASGGSNRFDVYRPPNKPEPKADGNASRRKFDVYREATPADSRPRRDDVSPSRAKSSGKRFSVYVPKEPETEKANGPKGSAWVEHDGLWVCVYGCKSFWRREAPNGVADNDYHAYNCPYWFNEGIDQTPFDDFNPEPNE